jgi:hypothetical protein
VAGGIDWLRWHHGTVSDAKLRLVAKQAGARVAEVVAVWAVLMETASQAANRGDLGVLDFESIDCALDLSDGLTKRIHTAMAARQMIGAGRLTAWEKRQPRRERVDDSAAERKRRQRTGHTKQEYVTPRHTTSHQKTPRGEERREDSNSHHSELPIHTGLSAAGSESVPVDAEGMFEGHPPIQPTPNPVAAFAIALGRLGYSVTSLNPNLVAYVADGGTIAHLLECGRHTDCVGKPASYPINMARRELKAKAQDVATGPHQRHAPSKTSSGFQSILEGTHHDQHRHENTDLVLDVDSGGAGDAVPAQPRRLPGG